MVVISTWGNPKGWSFVNYLCDKDACDVCKDDACSKGVKSKTTLPIFRDSTKVIVIPITLADKNVKDLVNEAIKEVERALHDDQTALNEFNGARKVVIPGRGHFVSNNVLKEFFAPTDTIIVSAILKLYPFIKDNVFLDITHGQNFYPVTVRGIVERLASIFSIIKKIELKIGGSDPFAKSPPPNLYFRVLEKKIIETKLSDLPKLITEKVQGSLAYVDSNYLGSNVKRVNDHLREIKRRVNDVNKTWKEILGRVKKPIRAFAVPSPLLWAYVLWELMQEKEVADKVREVLTNLERVIDEGYVVIGNKVYQVVSTQDKVDSVYLAITYLTLTDFAQRMIEQNKMTINDRVFLVDFNTIEKLSKHLSEDSEIIWRNEKERVDKIFKNDMYRQTLNTLRDCTECIIKQAKNILNDPSSLKDGKLKEKIEKINKYSKEIQLKPECVLNELTTLIKEGAVPYSFLRESPSVDNFITEALWWLTTVYILLLSKLRDLPSDVKNFVNSSLDEMERNFKAHGGLEQHVTLVKIEGSTKYIGYYRPAVEAIITKLTK